MTCFGVVAALTVPATAAGDHPAKRADLTVSFTALSQNGQIVAVKKFRFAHLATTCTQGAVSVHGHLPRMPVHDKRFRNKFQANGHRINVRGRFTHHGHVAKGTLRFRGQLQKGTTKYTHCDSGKQRWAVGSS